MSWQVAILIPPILVWCVLLGYAGWIEIRRKKLLAKKPENEGRLG